MLRSASSYDGNANLTQERHWDSTKAPSQPASLNSSNASVTGYLFDGHGNLNQVTDPLGNITHYTFDSNDLYLSQKVQAYGTGVARMFSYGWDFDSGLTTSKADANNNVTTSYSYDATGRQTDVTEDSTGLRRQTNTAYDDANRRVIVKHDQTASGDGLLVSVTNYDQLGRLALTQQLENALTQSPTDLTAGIKVQTRYQYSGANSYKLVSNPYRDPSSSAAGSACNNNYPQCTMGWTLSTNDQDGRVIFAQTFDGNGLPAPWGSNKDLSGTVSTAYKSQNTTVTDESGNARQSSVDGLGRLTSVVEDPGRLNYPTSYSYDTLNNLSGVNQSGRARSFLYDSLSRLSQATNPESGTVHYTYDADGNLSTKTDARGTRATYTYDALNRNGMKQYSDGTPLAGYIYDQAGAYSVGRLTNIINSNSATNYTSFDALGRVLGSSQTTQGQTFSFAYTYNLAGSVAKETYPSGRTVTTSYDKANRPYALMGVLSSLQTSYLTQTSYWPNGAANALIYGNNVVPTYWYDNRLRPYAIESSICNPSSTCNTSSAASLTSTYIQTLGYGWGPNSNLVSSSEGYGGPAASLPLFQQTYGYDTVNRLTSASDGGGWTRSFGYDAYGNLWEAGTGVPLAGNTPRSNIFTAANQISGGSYDAAGNQLLVNGNTLTYDAENRQSSETDGVTHAVETYLYDGDGQRVAKIAPSGTTAYLYDAAGQLASEYASSANSAPCSTCYLTWDHLGSTRLVTNQSGAVVARHDYLPFGEEVPAGDAGRAASQMFAAADNVNQKFTGKERDGESGLDYFGAKYYGSALGWFTSPDPDNTGAWLSDPQGWNMYAYGRNNPLRYVDPLDESYQICDANDKNCAKDELSDQEFGKEKQAAQGNGEHFSSGTAYHYDSNGNRVNDATYRQTDVDIDQSLAIGLHNAGMQSTAELNSFMKDAAVNAAGGFVLAGAGTAVSELWPAAENLPLFRQVSRILSNNSLKHIVNQGHLAAFQALDPSLTLSKVVGIGIDVAETGTQIGTKTFVKTVSIGGQQVEVKAVLNSNNGLRSVFPNR